MLILASEIYTPAYFWLLKYIYIYMKSEDGKEEEYVPIFQFYSEQLHVMNFYIRNDTYRIAQKIKISHWQSLLTGLH